MIKWNTKTPYTEIPKRICAATHSADVTVYPIRAELTALMRTSQARASEARERHCRMRVRPGGFLMTVTSALQVATPLQQAKCELLAFPWTPDVLAMCNLLAASANDIADLKRSYDAQNKGNQMPFNALLMPEMATLQDASGALSLPDLGEERAEHWLGEGCFTGRGRMTSKTLAVRMKPCV